MKKKKKRLLSGEQKKPLRKGTISWNSCPRTRTLPEAAGPLQACLHCFSVVSLFICTTCTPLAFRTENLFSHIQKEISRKNTTAVHIFRVGLAGSSLSRSLQYREMLSYISCRSAAVSLQKKKKTTDLYEKAEKKKKKGFT